MRIGILGCGHMGSWLARELAGSHQVFAFDPISLRVETLEGVENVKNQEKLNKLELELLINAVPLKETIPVFVSVIDNVSENCILCDVTSVKGTLPDYYRGCGHKFVSIHPMFGPTFANIRALNEESVVIIRESDSDTATFFHSFFEERGLKVFDYSFDEHDRMMAYSLTLPFVSTMVFAACMDKEIVPGTTFRKHREIAGGLLSEDDYLLAEILFNPHSMKQLERVIGRMDFLRHVISGRDYEEAFTFFNRLRDNMGESSVETCIS